MQSLRQAALSLLVILAILLSIGNAGNAAYASWIIPSGHYQYREKSDAQTRTFAWQISYLDDFVEITVDGEDYQTVNRCLDGGETIFWSAAKEDGTEVSAVREKNELIITRIEAGRRTIERQAIDERPWFQPLSYSLRRFLQSGEESITFWGIRMDTDRAVLLKATKIGREDVTLNNNTQPAMKVEIRLAGLMSIFWRGVYWYSRDNGLFLQFENSLKLPGVADKIVLVEKPGS